VPNPSSLKGKDIQRDGDEMEDDDAEGDLSWGMPSATTYNSSAFVESIPGESVTRGNTDVAIWKTNWQKEVDSFWRYLGRWTK
jgi:predicted phosphohydrolase